jgi:hypothetical protein
MAARVSALTFAVLAMLGLMAMSAAFDCVILIKEASS